MSEDELYDVIQVDDDVELTNDMSQYADRFDLSYIAVSSLQPLEALLQTANAQFFIVDGRFPRVDGGPEEELAESAIASIRGVYPEARIFLYSSNPNEDKFADLGLEGCFCKTEIGSVKLMQTIRDKISQIP